MPVPLVRRLHASLFVCLAVPVMAQSQDRPEDLVERFRVGLRPHLDRYCIRCHGEKRPKGGVVLAATGPDAIVSDFRLWHKVEHVIATGTMPPAKQRRRPDAGTRATMAAVVRAILDDGRTRRDPGRPVLRRLNRRQFDRTVSDLFLGLPFRSADRFPEDPQGYGFDSVGDVLFASPMLVEKYLDVSSVAIAALRKRDDLLQKLIPERPAPEAAGAEVRRLAARALRPMLRRGFRRVPTAAELESRQRIVAAELLRGVPFVDAVLAGFRSVLVSPHFLFRVESDRESDRPWRLTDDELAVRLSYFLWSTMPDERLFRLASEGRLAKDDVLRAEVARMLEDPRSRSLSEDFAGQWLGFRGILAHAVDFRRFQGFDGRLKRDLYEESVRFFDDLVRGNRPITLLLDSEHTFLNARLARHYGIGGVQGAELRKVDLQDRRRGGVLGMASVLTTTSYPLRTSPVLRGKWILENLLGDPPSPPPEDAGVLPADDKQRDELTLRQRLERHRREARCASCHAKMDPLGFALEPYDGVGRWRTENHGRKVDAVAELPDGQTLAGPAALKDWLLGQSDAFVRTAAAKMLVYALGRDLALPDERVLDDIVLKVRNQGDGVRVLVEAVVLSYPFRHRRTK